MKKLQPIVLASHLSNNGFFMSGVDTVSHPLIKKVL
jgi:hypothetical protein